jgi:hypothetical protein
LIFPQPFAKFADSGGHRFAVTLLLGDSWHNIDQFVLLHGYNDGDKSFAKWCDTLEKAERETNSVRLGIFNSLGDIPFHVLMKPLG